MKMYVKRVYAALIDILVVGIFVFGLYSIYFKSGIESGNFSVDMEWFRFEYELIYALSLFVYFIIGEMFDFSIGKKIFKIKIDYGKYIKTARVLRPLFKIVTFYIWPLAAISVFLNGNRLYYDYILKTDIETVKYERRDLR